MKKFMPISKEQLNAMPTNVREDVYSTLKAYDECNITYEYGKYVVSTCVGITKEYAPDHKFIGNVYVDDIYTLEERTQNYMEEFHDYPSWYTGKRDYAALRAKYGQYPIFD